MRLLYTSQSYVPSPRASTVQVLHMCDAFASLGHRVTLIGKRGTAGTAGIRDEFGLASDFEVISLPRPAHKGGGVVYGVAVCATVLRRRRRTDVVYARDQFGPVMAGLLRIPCVYEAHFVPRGVVRRMLRWAMNRPTFAGLVAISEALVTELEVAGLRSSSPVIVAPDAATDPGPFGPPPAPAPFRVGYAGSFAKGKGVEWLVDIASDLGDVEFVVMGGSPEQVARVSTGAPPNVRFVGHVPHATVASLLRECHVLVLPYRERVFGASETADITAVMSPLKLFEYLAVGRAIVATDLPVLREALPEGDGVTYVAADDRAGWVEAIRDHQRGPDTTSAAGAANRRRFEEGHTWLRRAAHVMTHVS